MIIQARLSNSFWAEAVATTRMVTTALKDGLTPYQLWFGKKPNLKHIRTFRCMMYSHVPEGERRKLDKKAHKLWFVGNTESTENYKLCDEVKRRCFVRHDVIFNEDDFGETKVEKEGLEAENEEPTETILPGEDPSQEEQPLPQPQSDLSLPQPQPASSLNHSLNPQQNRDVLKGVENPLFDMDLMTLLTKLVIVPIRLKSLRPWMKHLIVIISKNGRKLLMQNMLH